MDKIYTPEMETEDEEKRKKNRAIEAHIYLEDGDVWPVTASHFVICAGPQSGHIAYLAGIGSGKLSCQISQNGCTIITPELEAQKRRSRGLY